VIRLKDPVFNDTGFTGFIRQLASQLESFSQDDRMVSGLDFTF
jgi:hypothetical protein